MADAKQQAQAQLKALAIADEVDVPALTQALRAARSEGVAAPLLRTAAARLKPTAAEIDAFFKEHSDSEGSHANTPLLELAAKAREGGTARYRQGKIGEAAQWYSMAHRLSPTDPKPLSNRAACWLELGEYAQAAGDTQEALRLSNEEPDRVKLLGRLGKAQFFAGEAAAAADTLRRVHDGGGLDAASTHLLAALEDWSDDALQCEHSVASLPTCRPSPISVLEYYPISNEDACSALGGRVVRGRGEQAEDRLSIGGKRRLRIFFGGCADGRHVFRTLMDLFNQLGQWPAKKRQAFEIELTLNDHKAESLARDVVVLALLYELGELGAAIKEEGSTGEAALHAAVEGRVKAVSNLQWLLYYTLLGAFMPPAMSNHLQVRLTRLATEPPPSWIRCDDVSWGRLQETLSAWAHSSFTAKAMNSMLAGSPNKDYRGDMTSGESETFDEWTNSAAAANREGFLAVMAAMPDDQVMAIPNVPGGTAKEKREALRLFANSPAFLSSQKQHSSRVAPAEDVEFWEASRVLPEPSSGHSSLGEEQLYKSAPPKKLRLGWCANPTLVDHSQLSEAQRTHGRGARGAHVFGEQVLCLDPFEIVNAMTAGLPTTTKGPTTFYDVVMHELLVPLSLALHQLSHGTRFALRPQWGDMHAAVEARDAGAAGVYDRCCLSNVPDYTSMLNTFLYFIPALPADGEAVIEHTLLLANPKYRDLQADYVYSHTLLRPEHVTLCTGAVLKSGDVMDQDGRPRWARAASHGGRAAFLSAGRAVVESWLHRLTLAVVWPPTRDANEQMREICPLTVSTIFRALERLLQLGCPVHWLAAFCQALLADGALSTVEEPPASSPVRLPPAGSKARAARRVDLGLCNLEARTVGAVWAGRLGRTVLACGAVAPPASLRRLTVCFEPLEHPTWKRGCVVATLTMGLLLADSAVPEVKTALATLQVRCPAPIAALAMLGMPSVTPVEGAVRRMGASCPSGSVHWLSCLTWDSRRHEASFLLPQAELDALTAADSSWVAVPFRSDSWAVLAQTKQLRQPSGRGCDGVAADAAAPALPAEGSRVVLCGLKAVSLNGLHGRVVGADELTGRAIVQLDDGAGRSR